MTSPTFLNPDAPAGRPSTIAVLFDVEAPEAVSLPERAVARPKSTVSGLALKLRLVEVTSAALTSRARAAFRRPPVTVLPSRLGTRSAASSIRVLS